MSNKLYAKYGKNTNVTQRPVGKEKNRMIKNHTGGYVFKLSDSALFERFLVLGIEGTMYQSGAVQLAQYVPSIFEFIDAFGNESLALILNVANENRALKYSSVLFAYAYLVKTNSDTRVRSAGYAHMQDIIRTPTQMFEFIEYCEKFGGWSSGLRKAVNRWYLSKNADSLAYQLLKYRQRNGWTHRDVWNLSHVFSYMKSNNVDDNGTKLLIMQAAYDDFDMKVKESGGLPEIVHGYLSAQKAKSVEKVVKVITKYGLTREMIPTEYLHSKEVWEALLPKMPMTALIRNLSSMTRAGLFDKFGSDMNTKHVVSAITDGEALQKSRIHPYTLMKAAHTYESGAGIRSTWDVMPKISDALAKAFEESFANVEPSGKNFLFGCDASGSMTWNHQQVDGMSIAPYKIAVLLALAAMKVEEYSYMIGYDHNVHEFGITAADNFHSAVLKAERGIKGGSTDGSIPFKYAMDNNLMVDVFVHVTDNEVNTGRHPYELFKEYKKKFNKNAKWIVIGLTVSDFSIGDPDDNSVLSIAGFDAGAVKVISEFAKS